MIQTKLFTGTEYDIEELESAINTWLSSPRNRYCVKVIDIKYTGERYYISVMIIYEV